MTNKIISITLHWRTGKPEKNGTYLVALSCNDGILPGHIYHLYELPYSATYRAWNCYDEVGAPDGDERAYWDTRVRYWTYIDETLEMLNAAYGE